MIKRFLLAFFVVTLALIACAHPAEAKTPQTDWQIVQQLCKKTGKKIKLVKSNKMTDEKFWKILDHRKGKDYVIVEKVVSVSDGKTHGWYSTKTKGSKYIIGYNKKVKKGKKVVSYVIWNPNSNECDDVLWVVDNQKYR